MDRRRSESYRLAEHDHNNAQANVLAIDEKLNQLRKELLDLRRERAAQEQIRLGAWRKMHAIENGEYEDQACLFDQVDDGSQEAMPSVVMPLAQTDLTLDQLNKWRPEAPIGSGGECAPLLLGDRYMLPLFAHFGSNDTGWHDLIPLVKSVSEPDNEWAGNVVLVCGERYLVGNRADGVRLTWGGL